MNNNDTFPLFYLTVTSKCWKILFPGRSFYVSGESPSFFKAPSIVFFTLFGDALSAGSPLIATSPWLPPPGHEGDACLRSSDCLEGYCCARHFWTKICKPVLRQGEVCTKQRKKGAHGLEIFQRCDCAKGLSCKVWKDATSSTKSRLHMCQKIWSGGAAVCVGASVSVCRGRLKGLLLHWKAWKAETHHWQNRLCGYKRLNIEHEPSGWDCCKASAVSGPPLHPHAPSLPRKHTCTSRIRQISEVTLRCSPKTQPSLYFSGSKKVS